jgi:hypothetical protein
MLRPAATLTGLLVYAAGFTILTVALSSQKRTEPTMHNAAKTFLASLEPEKATKALFPFNAEERLNWHFVPKERKGVPFKELTTAQREAAMTLLRVSLSQKGFEKAETIRSLENVLREIEKGSGPTRDPELYYSRNSTISRSSANRRSKMPGDGVTKDIISR